MNWIPLASELRRKGWLDYVAVMYADVRFIFLKQGEIKISRWSVHLTATWAEIFLTNWNGQLTQLHKTRIRIWKGSFETPICSWQKGCVRTYSKFFLGPCGGTLRNCKRKQNCKRYYTALHFWKWVVWKGCEIGIHCGATNNNRGNETVVET